LVSPLLSDESSPTATACLDSHEADPMPLSAERLHEIVAQVESRTDDAILLTAPSPADPQVVQIVWCNAGFEQMTGYAAAEIVGREVGFLRGPDTDPDAIAEIARARAAGRPFRVTLLNYRKDGAPFWVDIAARPCGAAGADGGLLYLNVQRDITALKRREQALAEALASSALLAAAWDAATSEIQIIDPETLRYLKLNAAARRALGVDDAGAAALSPAETWAGFTEDRLRRVIAPLLADDVCEVALEVARRRADGGTTPCALRLSAFRHQQATLILAVVDDLSEQAAVARRLSLSERRLQLAMEACADGVWERTLPGDQVFFSARNREMLGYAEDEFPGSIHSWRACVHPDDLDRLIDALRALERDDRPFEELYRVRRKDGRWLWWRSRAVAMRDGDGRAVRIIGTNSDVTELVEARRAAETMARAKADFLAKMSHEIRTPLNGVLGMAELMRYAEDDPEKLSRIDTILSSGRSLLTIIEDVLTLAQIESGASRPRDEVFELDRLLQAAFDPVRVTAQTKGLRLAAAPVAGRWTGDVRRMRQVLINLVGNAVKHTDSGVIRLDATPQGAMLRFEVSDSGPGVPAAMREAIFEPFHQGEWGAARGEGGLGLGLAVAREFVRAIGGEIGVEDAPGGGARFWFTAPVAPAASPAVAASRTRERH